MQDKLSLETLGQLDDGTVGAVANAAIAEALADCDDRPFLEKGRKVTVEIVINPVLDGSVLKGVDVAVGVKLTKPPQAAREQYLRTTVDTGSNKLTAMLADSYQDGLWTGKKEVS